MVDKLPLVSNEVELNVSGISAKKLLKEEVTSVFVLPEVNEDNVVELNVSQAKDIDELNERLSTDLHTLSRDTKALGGEIYGGSLLLEDVSGIEPKWQRTTSLSVTCARNFLDMCSIQVVIGVSGERFGIDLFNYFRNVNPVLLALSSSSPYALVDGIELRETSMLSKRIHQYEKLCERFPSEMLLSAELESMSHFERILQDISAEVNARLTGGRLDVNAMELFRDRESGPYAPFSLLDPHQVFWMTRFRPDHKNEECDFSVEMRVCDLPINLSGMKYVNTFILGIAYCAEQEGFSDFPTLEGAEFANLAAAAQTGLSAPIGKDNKDLRSYVVEMSDIGARGLRYRGFETQAQYLETQTEKLIGRGSDAEVLLAQNFQTPQEMKRYLIDCLLD